MVREDLTIAQQDQLVKTQGFRTPISMNEMMRPESRIYVAGHAGLVGSALLRRLEAGGYRNLIVRRHSELDLTDQQAVNDFFASESPEFVFLAAARVGGIQANADFPADFIYSNLAIQNHVIEGCRRHGARKLLFLGSSCIYPKFAPQPIREEHLLTGPLEPTNEPYAVAKIAGIKLCNAYNRQHGTNFICAMPTNLYGPGDNFDSAASHVVPALIGRFHRARVSGAPTVTVWGSGTPRRELMHSEDAADACVFLMERIDARDIGEVINVGTGSDITIRELAELIAQVTGFDGRIEFDPTRPDGTPLKRMDVSRLSALGWKPRIGLRAGIESTYRGFLESPAAGAKARAGPAAKA